MDASTRTKETPTLVVQEAARPGFRSHEAVEVRRTAHKEKEGEDATRQDTAGAKWHSIDDQLDRMASIASEPLARRGKTNGWESTNGVGHCPSMANGSGKIKKGRSLGHGLLHFVALSRGQNGENLAGLVGGRMRERRVGVSGCLLIHDADDGPTTSIGEA